MRIAVTYENGTVFQHFGHTEQFKIYEIEDGKIVKEEITDTGGQGHGALAGLLTGKSVDALICGGIGGGAQAALAEAGIQLFGGVSGSADDAVRSYLAGTLAFDPNVHCSHHGTEHSCSSHAESHSCGTHANAHSCGTHAEEHSCSSHAESHSCGTHANAHSCGTHAEEHSCSAHAEGHIGGTNAEEHTGEIHTEGQTGSGHTCG